MAPGGLDGSASLAAVQGLREGPDRAQLLSGAAVPGRARANARSDSVRRKVHFRAVHQGKALNLGGPATHGITDREALQGQCAVLGCWWLWILTVTLTLIGPCPVPGWSSEDNSRPHTATPPKGQTLPRRKRAGGDKHLDDLMAAGLLLLPHAIPTQPVTES